MSSGFHVILLALIVCKINGTKLEEVKSLPDRDTRRQLPQLFTLGSLSLLVDADGFDLLVLTSANYSSHFDVAGLTMSAMTVSLPGVYVPKPTLFSFKIPEILLARPQSVIQFEKIIQSIGDMMAKDSTPWKKWKPTYLIRWPKKFEFNELEIHIKPFMRSSMVLYPLNFPLDLNLFIFTEDEKMVREVYEVYRLGSRLRLQKLSFKPVQVLNFDNYLPKAFRRQNFRRTAFRAAVYNDRDYEKQIQWARDYNGKVLLVGGFAATIFDALKFRMNFSPEIIIGEGWVHQLPNGTWTGVARQVRDNEADVSINLSTFLLYRAKGLDILHPISTGDIFAVFRQPDTSTIRDIIISPLHPTLWAAVIGMVVILLLSMKILIILNQRYIGSVLSEDELIEKNSALWILGAFAQQGWYTSPIGGSLKILFFSGTLLGVLTFMSFSAALVQILSLETFPITNSMDLARSQLELYGDYWSPFSEIEIKKLESFRTNYKKPPIEKQFIDIDESIEVLRRGGTAFLTFSAGFRYVYERHGYSLTQFCSMLSTVSVNKGQTTSGFVVRKGSEFKEVLNTKILEIMESGVGIRNRRIYDAQWGIICDNRKGTQQHEKLEVRDVATSYLILAIGVISSLLILIIENIFKKYEKRESSGQ